MESKYAHSANKKNYGIILAAMVDTKHELPEKKFQIVKLLAGNDRMRYNCVDALTEDQIFLNSLLHVTKNWGKE